MIMILTITPNMIALTVKGRVTPGLSIPKKTAKNIEKARKLCGQRLG